MQLVIRKKGLSQLGASAIEYGLVLAVITTMVMAGAKLMTPDIRATFTNASQSILDLANSGGGNSDFSNSENNPNTDSSNSPPDNQVAIAPAVVWTVRVIVAGVPVAIKLARKQLDKKFKHAKDFGVNTTKKNPQTIEQFKNGLKKHLEDPATIQKGKYRNLEGSKVYYNPKTNNAVVIDKSGNFNTGVKLEPGTKQYNHYMETGLLW